MRWRARSAGLLVAIGTLLTQSQCSEMPLKLPADEPIRLFAECPGADCPVDCVGEGAALPSPVRLHLEVADDLPAAGWPIQFSVTGGSIVGSNVQVTDNAGEVTLNLIADSLGPGAGRSAPIVIDARAVDRPSVKTQLTLTATQSAWLTVIEPSDTLIDSDVDRIVAEVDGPCDAKLAGVTVRVFANDGGDSTQFNQRAQGTTLANGQVELDANIDQQCREVTIRVVGASTNTAVLRLRREPPSVACNPSPANQATNVPFDAGRRLTWACGTSCGQTTYNFYFGTVSPPQLVGSTTSQEWTLPQLNANTQYYWRVDSQYADRTTQGPVWSFTTRNR